jgi:hypothetical protein
VTAETQRPELQRLSSIVDGLTFLPEHRLNARSFKNFPSQQQSTVGCGAGLGRFRSITLALRFSFFHASQLGCHGLPSPVPLHKDIHPSVMTARVPSLVLGLLLLASGHHGRVPKDTDLHRLEVEELVSRLGVFGQLRSSGAYEQLEYTHRLIAGWSWDRSDFKVILKGGRVVEFGHGEIRDRSPQVVYVHSDTASQPERPIIYLYSPQPQTIDVNVQPPPTGPRSWTNPYGN